MTRRVLVTGASGILGRQLQARCPQGWTVLPFARSELDITDRQRVREVIAAAKPDAVVHAAAMTRVDDCEKEVDHTFRVNWIGTQNVAEAAAAVDAHMVHLSTDYVFDGTKVGPYLEEDPTGPLSVYGRSKLFAERAVQSSCRRWAVLRTQWVYGPGGTNFVDTMRRLGGEGKSLQVVDDQHGCPTFAGHLADGIYRVLDEDPGSGIYHLSGGGATTWFQFAREIFRQTSLEVEVSPCSTEQFPRPAPRPANGVMRNYRLELSIGDPMPAWQKGLEEYLSLTQHASP